MLGMNLLDCSLFICNVCYSVGKLVGVLVGFVCRWWVLELIVVWLSDWLVVLRCFGLGCRLVVDMFSRVLISVVCLIRVVFSSLWLVGLFLLLRMLLVKCVNLLLLLLVWCSVVSILLKIVWMLVRVVLVLMVSLLLW